MEVDNLLKGMQEKIDAVSASLQAYQGQPEQLALFLKQEFNTRSQTVQTLDAEICKIAKQVKELRSKITAARGKGKTGPEVLKTGYTVPIKPYIQYQTQDYLQYSPQYWASQLLQISSVFCQRMKLHIQS